MDAFGLGVVLLAAALLLILPRFGHKGIPKFRNVAALTRLYRAVGRSIEDGTRVLVGLGGPSLLTSYGASALAGLGVVQDAAKQTSVSDRPPVAVAGEAALALLAQDALHTGFAEAGAAEFFQPASGRLAGMTPFSSAAGMMPIFSDEHVSVAALVGHFGVEAALLADAADRDNLMLVGASDDPSAQAALFASASEAVIGEEIYASAAYLGGRAALVASLTAQDVLRWLIILGMLGGAALRILGLI